MKRVEIAADEPAPAKVPWNKGKLIGSKPPLRTKHVWSIRTKLQVEGRTRDLALFNLAIDSKLRGCDVVSLKVEDVAPHGLAIDRATVRQTKTGHAVRFELSEQTREAVDDDRRAAGRKPGAFLFPSRRYPDRAITTRQYARSVAEWIASIGLDPRLFGPHSLRRTKAAPPTAAPEICVCRVVTRQYENREHSSLSWHRGRRCSCDSRTD